MTDCARRPATQQVPVQRAQPLLTVVKERAAVTGSRRHQIQPTVHPLNLSGSGTTLDGPRSKPMKGDVSRTDERWLHQLIVVDPVDGVRRTSRGPTDDAPIASNLESTTALDRLTTLRTS